MKALIQSANNLLQNLERPISVKVRPFNLNDVANRRDFTEQFKENRAKFVAEMEKKIVVEGSIEDLQKMYRELVTNLDENRNYIENGMKFRKVTIYRLDEITEVLQPGLDELAKETDFLNQYFSLNPEQINEEDPQHNKVIEKYKALFYNYTQGTLDKLCKIICDLEDSLRELQRKISGIIPRLTRITQELRGSLTQIRCELEKSQRRARDFRTGFVVLGFAAGFMTGGLAALLAVGGGAIVTIRIVEKIMEKEIFKKAETQWNEYSTTLKGSGLLRIIGQKMISENDKSPMNTHIIRAGEAFKEMHTHDANSKQIAKKYFKDRMVALLIFSGVGFIDFLKWFLSHNGSTDVKGFVESEVDGILFALNNMATDIAIN